MLNERNAFRSILFIAAILFTLAPACADNIENEQTQKEVSATWVFIGDSYAHFGEVDLSALIAKKLKLKPQEYRVFCGGGYGFANQWAGGHRFITLIADEQKDKNIRNVLVIGGIGNDLHIKNLSTLESETTAFYKAVREKYPNAVIWHAIPNWRSSRIRGSDEEILAVAHWQRRILKREAFVQKFDRKNGVHLLKKARNAIRITDNDRYFSKDGKHPSWEGRVKIAKAIAKEIKSSKVYKSQQAKAKKAVQ